MKKGRSIWIGAGVIAVVAVGAFAVFRKPAPTTPEPVYNGKPVSFFIDRPSINILPSGTGIRPLVQFPRTVDLQALPYLINALHRRNGPFLKVSQTVWNASPVFVKNRWAKPLDVAHVRAAAALVIGNFGPAAESATPELIRTVNEDEDPEVRACAAFALSQIAVGNKAALECLTTASKETNTVVGGTAQTALYRVQGPAARPNPSTIIRRTP